MPSAMLFASADGMRSMPATCERHLVKTTMYSYKCGHCGRTLIIGEQDIRPLWTKGIAAMISP